MKILAAAETIVKSLGMDLNSKEIGMQSDLIKELRNKLSDEEYSKYYDEGINMTTDEACELAVRQLVISNW
ncbi:MAG: hypothetical protein IPG78_16330 [Ignavibacteria bacterium]|nr:hypothetical protein [Ignavibacteria bacterium]